MSSPEAAPDEPAPRAVVFSCAGPTLSPAEHDLFRTAQPMGFILFGRNCQSPAQLRHLVSALRNAAGRPNIPVLIDQEGGRVARLKPPHWRASPAAARFGALADRDPQGAARAAWLNARLMAAELQDAGITIDCAPTLDLARPETTTAIGDRAHSHDPEHVALLGKAVCEGLMAGGVLPVIKHLPGHGRATVDSHHKLPVVTDARAILASSDFRPFEALAHMPLGMTCHLQFSQIDPHNPATQSEIVIADVIRGDIGFAGFLFSDDISMQALAGDLTDRTVRALAAGCDAVLHCTGDLAEMSILAETTPALSTDAAARLDGAISRRTPPEPSDAGALEDELGSLLADAASPS